MAHSCCFRFKTPSGNIFRATFIDSIGTEIVLPEILDRNTSELSLEQAVACAHKRLLVQQCF